MGGDGIMEKIIKKTTPQHPTAGAPIFADQAPDVFMAGRS